MNIYNIPKKYYNLDYNIMKITFFNPIHEKGEGVSKKISRNLITVRRGA